MKQLWAIAVVGVMALAACASSGGDDATRERELDLREREIALRETELASTGATATAAPTTTKPSATASPTTTSLAVTTTTPTTAASAPPPTIAAPTTVDPYFEMQSTDIFGDDDADGVQNGDDPDDSGSTQSDCSSYSYNDSLPLRPCDTGFGVEQVQAALAALGYGTTVDGLFGVTTEAMVREFQWEHGLEIDGLVGPATFLALFGDQRNTGYPDLNGDGIITFDEFPFD